MQPPDGGAGIKALGERSEPRVQDEQEPWGQPAERATEIPSPLTGLGQMNLLPRNPDSLRPHPGL